MTEQSRAVSLQQTTSHAFNSAMQKNNEFLYLVLICFKKKKKADMATMIKFHFNLAKE